MNTKGIFLAGAMAIAPGLLHAQFDFKLGDRDVQVHSFISQGFALSNQNNFLTMDTSDGSARFTDGGVNMSSQVTDKFRVGAQGYVRSIGQLGHGHVTLDWAMADYRFTQWFGIRGGRVKTSLGLYNDTQDAESVHTWALLPQSIYPLDLRAITIAHDGGDIYGDISLHKAGRLSYVAYAGFNIDDKTSGQYYSVADAGGQLSHYKSDLDGFDVRWTTPVEGLMIGGSVMQQRSSLWDTIAKYGNAVLTEPDNHPLTTAAYIDYARGKWHFSTEYRRRHEFDTYYIFSQPSVSNTSTTGWFGSVAYKATKRLEIGAYNSRFYVDKPSTPGSASDHLFDQAITARYDLTHFWNVKVEGHFMDGHADTYSAQGFYTRNNPTGVQPTTALLVIRTGLTF